MVKSVFGKTVMLALFLSLFIVTLNVEATSNTAFYWSPNVHFGLPAYNTTISFNDWIYMNSFTWDTIDATQITFNNIQMDGNTLSSWSISVENGNVTINKLFADNQLQFTVSAPSHVTSTTKVYCGVEGKPTSVAGATSWSYDDSTNILTVNMLHSSPQQVTVEWVATAALRTLIRNNYYVLFGLISLAPIIFGAILIVKLIKGKESVQLSDIYGMIGIAITIIIGYIIIWNVMNAIIGG